MIAPPETPMYVYDKYDQQIIDERVAQYRDQRPDKFLAWGGMDPRRGAPRIGVGSPSSGAADFFEPKILSQLERCCGCCGAVSPPPEPFRGAGAGMLC